MCSTLVRYLPNVVGLVFQKVTESRANLVFWGLTVVGTGGFSGLTILEYWHLSNYVTGEDMQPDSIVLWGPYNKVFQINYIATPHENGYGIWTTLLDGRNSGWCKPENFTHLTPPCLGKW